MFFNENTLLKGCFCLRHAVNKSLSAMATLASVFSKGTRLGKNIWCRTKVKKLIIYVTAMVCFVVLPFLERRVRKYTLQVLLQKNCCIQYGSKSVHLFYKLPIIELIYLSDFVKFLYSYSNHVTILLI